MDQIYVAVILKHDGTKPAVQRNAVTATTKEAAIEGAINLRDSWSRQETCGHPTRIFVGQLTAEVVTPKTYELRSLDV